MEVAPQLKGEGELLVVVLMVTVLIYSSQTPAGMEGTQYSETVKLTALEGTAIHGVTPLTITLYR